MAYTIQKGDTLSGIASANKTTVQDLLKLNPNISNPNLIQAGGSLNLQAPTQEPFIGPKLPVYGPQLPEGYTLGKTDPSNVKVPDVTSAADLGTAKQPEIPPPTQTIKTPDATVMTADDYLKKYQEAQAATAKLPTEQATTEQSGLYNRLKELYTQQAPKASDLLAEQQKAGISDINQKIQEQNLLISQLTGQYNKNIAALPGQGRGITTSIIQGQTERERRIAASEIGAQTSILQALQGNLTLAKQTAQDAIDLKYGPIEKEIEQKLKLLELNTPSFNAAETKKADALKAILEQQKQDTADKKTEEQNISQVLLQAAQKNAPLDVLNKIKNSTNINDAILNAGQYAGDKNEYQSGIVGEYKFYADSERQAGRVPMTFDEYQTKDANRKAQQLAANGLTPQQNATFLNISNKYQADGVVNQGQKATSVVQIAEQVLANPKDATNQLKSLYTLVKNLDPDSAVREGEVQLASMTQSYLNRWKTTLDSVFSGQVISPQAATDLANASKDLATVWADAARRRDKQYIAQAQVGGVGEAFNTYLNSFDRNYAGTSGATDTPNNLQLNASYSNTSGILRSQPEFKPLVDSLKTEGLSESDILQYINSRYSGFSNDLSMSQNSSAKKIAIAIKQKETGGNYNLAGATGEAPSAYQFLPSTWKEWAGKYLGNPNAPLTKENQDFVAESKIQDLLNQGYNAKEIALIWNGGVPYAKKGINKKYGVAYDSGKYAEDVLNILNKLG